MSIQAFDYSVDATRSLLWRHNEAVNLQSLINDKQSALDELNKDFWTDWKVDVFDLTTANIFGLYVWTIILDLPLTIVEDRPENLAWGFGAFRKNFNNGNFTGDSRVLLIEEARTVLRLRYYQCTIRPTITNINKILQDVFAYFGTGYVLDNLDMTMTYVLDFIRSPQMRLIMLESDVLPRPSGVSSTVLEIP